MFFLLAGYFCFLFVPLYHSPVPGNDFSQLHLKKPGPREVQLGLTWAQVSCLWTPHPGCQERDKRATLLAEEPLARSTRTGATFLSLCLLALSQPVAPATLFLLSPTPSSLSRENQSDVPRGFSYSGPGGRCDYNGPGGVASVVQEVWLQWSKGHGYSGP